MQQILMQKGSWQEEMVPGTKPFRERGLLIKLPVKHENVLVDMKGYEILSRNNGVAP